DRCQRNADRETCAHENTGKHVTTEIVRTEPELRCHRPEIIEIDDFTDRMRNEIWREDRNHGPEKDDEKAENADCVDLVTQTRGPRSCFDMIGHQRSLGLDMMAMMSAVVMRRR